MSISFLHDVFALANNALGFVPSWMNTADLFTKFLSHSLHSQFCQDLGLVSIGQPGTPSVCWMRGSIRAFDPELEPDFSAGLKHSSDDSELVELARSLKSYFTKHDLPDLQQKLKTYFKKTAHFSE